MERLNRFVARVIYRGEEALCHVPNSGRLRELLIEGVKLRVRPAKTERKTACSLLMVQYKGQWVVIDAHKTNALMLEAMTQGCLPEFTELHDIKREITFSKSRFDFSFIKDDQVCFLEVKCSTLVEEDSVARFPDAPTSRGTKHVLELIKAYQAGFGAYVVFVVQNPHALSFSPNHRMDKAFCHALSEARIQGVEVLAYLCRTDKDSITIEKRIAIDFESGVEYS
ncbi:MAG: DNA/RNA nuclease SfsA [Desulfobacterales bacterium]|nr:DNA/RNA nuclease SfsA [Desulfobacterales bacterium]